MTKNVIFAVLATALSLFSTNAKAEADPNFSTFIFVSAKAIWKARELLKIATFHPMSASR